ncbi:MAG TPA: ABC transporter ATP-binding protein [Polyangiaceae bacterium]|nr:ABC transporter ATP-binding protein [Polyangiaceae bacterium]
MTAALSTRALSKSFGGFAANSGIDFTLERGARHALIGPNGAGKTTFVNLLTGVHPPTSGEVFLEEERVTHLSQHERVKRGLTRTFQINTLFPGLTVLESIVLAIGERKGSTHVWHQPVTRQRETIEEARELLGRLSLTEDAGRVTRWLSYGKQRLVEIALALATRPRVLVLDEPAAGIPSHTSAELFGVLERLPRDMSILLIEHDMDLVFRFAERITVFANGSVLADGAPAEVAADRRVREVYLGESDHG